jgi:hypothetical protein
MNAPKATQVSVAAVLLPWRRAQAHMHQSPPITSTMPPKGREPVLATTA